MIDARGYECPIPVLLLRRDTRDKPPGYVVELLTTDPLAHLDVEAYCRKEGLAWRLVETVDGAMRHRIDVPEPAG